MIIEHLPSPQELKATFPLSRDAQAFVLQSRQRSQQIFTQRDTRKVFILGPCSIHDEASALSYADHLLHLSQEVAPTSHLIMRVYTEKPRTQGGWKGFLYDPNLDGSHALKEGLIRSRKLLVDLAEMGVACAMEFVNPLTALYLEDLISWGFIGARTVYSQPHRELASSLSIPIGFKNSLEGSLESGVCALEAAAEVHTFLHATPEGEVCMIRSEGNPYTHLVLRGSLQGPNYDAFSLKRALALLERRHLKPRLMIDCSHGNAQKLAMQQKEVFLAVLQEMRASDAVLGMMLESHLNAGNQPLHADLDYGVSITDPCIDWETTAQLLLSAHAELSASRYVTSCIT
jgi:3-deoxy-7-phosphoheptulonate synthase